ncbi:HlyD family secretion protein [Roseateles toxinivorans]|uniref:HlyD family secretion protein n=1 Tax=Roseateles toxinivorans TaxID=270368 RepID=A0A4R6QSV5_9BURK|nr:HlyD family efflux transporter periplasmic adaptor subunit [Roseateles toxinivorans]TDP72921.1 HlyD family secretion protein [Roseateles toxinivorans]
MRRLILLSALIALTGCGEPAAPAWSGYAEGEYVYLSSPVAGSLQALNVQRGQQVAQGAALFTLDAELERGASAEAKARLDAAQAQAANTAKGRRSDEIQVVQAQLAQARTQAGLAQRELERQQQLVAQGFVSAARIDEAKAAVTATQARVAELSASLQVAQLPARVDEQRAAQAQGEAARQGLQQTLWREQQKQRSAPSSGLIADTFFRVGEWVPAGQPVLALLPAGHVKLRFFVPAAELAGIAPGQMVNVGCDGCGAAIKARISFIATQAEYTPPVIYSNAQRSKLVFMVEALPEGADASKLKPGLPVDVRRVAP